MIDAHAHLEFYKKEAEAIIEKARSRMKAIVDSITEYRKFHVWKSWEMLKPYFGFLFPTLGYHPNEARRGNWEKVRKVEEFILDHKKEIYAIGEIGLDYYHAKTEVERRNQEEIFRHFLTLAEELKLPVVIHAREAEDVALRILQNFDVKAYFHSYTGPVKVAREIVENGHFVGIVTGITFIPEVRDVARALELENILVETDSPYMSPYKGVKNKPWFVEVVINELAKIKEVPREEVEAITERNAKVFFGLPLV
ncbi:YchF/TatD family DNA exonuclease [Pyrococcus abyssi]|uniref:TatD related DNAse n=1 Tax=Pyrococcus abyssi (strain GE5 / Orsay) TaxID=272844 RepID=Q9UZT3_PYRAB|nr:YchF/TatD family DNA exonuclease [Pyrococcus abyssi]CAB49973.1 tatD related DNAse [Pyrococcus abyssi GE5]CCE70473.1 TPA: TatD-related deoxyribonuclease [Pyrococcus abyssi GE5]